MTYRELEERANQLAHHLRSLGIRPGTRVGILLHRSSLTYVSLLGVLKAGAAFVPIDPASPQDRVQYIADDAEIDLLITSTDLAAHAIDLERPLLKIDAAEAMLASAPVTRPPVADAATRRAT